MRLTLIAIWFTCATAYAQRIVDPARIRGPVPGFEEKSGEERLRCEVTPLRPALGFTFRFQAGYVVSVPMSQYLGAGHLWSMLTRITADGGSRRPVYLLTRARLPEVPKTKVVLQVGGGYLLGEGGYSVKWMLFDDAGRVCRKSWHVDVKLAHGESKVKVAMPRDTVWELSLRNTTASRRDTDDAAPIRLTVLLHAAPLFPRRTRLRPGDMMMLLSSLSALLERVPARPVRLVVFNLDQQKELFRRDEFTLDALDEVAQSMNGVELGLVDYHVLQNRSGPVDLIADLVNQEIRAPTPSDVVVFLGPQARYSDKVPSGLLERSPGSVPQFFYFQYRPFLRMAAPGMPGAGMSLAGNLPDSIQSAVTRLNGKMVVIHTPGEFAKAIDRLEHRTSTGN